MSVSCELQAGSLDPAESARLYSFCIGHRIPLPPMFKIHQWLRTGITNLFLR
jgi:hypothetical protein